MTAERIVKTEDSCRGQARVKGTRVTVSAIAFHWLNGLNAIEIGKEFGLSRKDVLAALAYAKDQLP